MALQSQSNGRAKGDQRALRAANDVRQRVDEILRGDGARRWSTPPSPTARTARGSAAQFPGALARRLQLEMRALTERQVRAVRPVDIGSVGIAIDRLNVGIDEGGSINPATQVSTNIASDQSHSADCGLTPRSRSFPVWLHRLRGAQFLWVPKRRTLDRIQHFPALFGLQPSSKLLPQRTVGGTRREERRASKITTLPLVTMP